MEPEEYIARHIDVEPPQLEALWRRTNLRHVYPRMCCGHVQGRLLKMLTAMVAPRRILEIGAFTGYSTLCLAEGMPEGCTLDTVEVDDEREDELHTLFAADARGVDIRLHIGDAMEVVPRLPGQWDLVLLDADKRMYLEMLEMVAARVPIGGIILADNTLWSGKVMADDAAHADAQTRALARFNDAVAADTRFQKVILPIRDGMTIMRRVR